MDRLLIVGSGASGVHFALSVLKKGYDVIMVDVGASKPDGIDREGTLGERTFNELRGALEDPSLYFLGADYESVVYPRADREYYGLPPNKKYLFARPAAFEVEARGFEPLFSFAQGGLAEAWTGGVYPLNDHELAEFPFDYADMEPYYNQVANRIGITGVKDDLSRFFPYHDHLLEPLRLDPHSARLLAAYERNKEHLASRLKCYMGRSRVAVLSRDQGDRKACSYRGRCLWGCPSAALYTPSITLAECRRYSNFTYIPNRYVSRFKYDADRRITAVVAESVVGEAPREIRADRFILAAGTLSSTNIYLQSIREATRETVVLPGLMDNRQILMPFITLGEIGHSYNPESYQYHQLALGIEGERPEEYIHGQITTLKGTLGHPIIHNMPMDLRTSIFLFRNVRAALGVVNVNLCDRRRGDDYVTLEADRETGRSRLVIHYTPPGDEKAVIGRAMRAVRRSLWRLGCVVAPGMSHIRPMGASVHYSGTIPMAAAAGPHTASKHCRSHYFENLYLVDGTTFPFLPAKNLTFTLMANAVRVAEEAF